MVGGYFSFPDGTDACWRVLLEMMMAVRGRVIGERVNKGSS